MACDCNAALSALRNLGSSHLALDLAIGFWGTGTTPSHLSSKDQSDICLSRKDPVRFCVPEEPIAIALWIIPGSELAVALMQLGIHNSRKIARFLGLSRVVYTGLSCLDFRHDDVETPWWKKD